MKISNLAGTTGQIDFHEWFDGEVRAAVNDFRNEGGTKQLTGLLEFFL